MNPLYQAYFSKYRFLFTALAVWLVLICVSDYTPIKKWEMNRELAALRKQESYFRQEINKTHRERSEISRSAATLETFARERYLMRRTNEEVFLLMDENGNPIE